MSSTLVSAPWVRILSKDEGFDVLGSPSGVMGHQVERANSERPSGVYVEWGWDGRTLTARNDRAGMGQMLYAEVTHNGQRGIALSPHVEKLIELGADPKIDDDAMSVLLRVGFHIGCDTPFGSIRALPPNATLRWSANGLEISCGAVRNQRDLMGDRSLAIDTYVDLFRQAMERRPVSGRCALPLTGGNDSRHILFELMRLGTPPELTVTVRRYRRVLNDDAAAAERLAGKLGIEHRRAELTGSIVDEDFRKYDRSGPLSDEGSWASVLWDHIRGFDCSYDGIAGDVLGLERLGSIPYGQLHPLVEAKDWGGLADRVLGFYAASDSALKPLLDAASFRDQGRSRVRDRLVAELETHADQPHPLALFLLNTRTRREIAMMPWLLCQELTPYFAPYLDEDLFDAIAAVPARIFSDGGFHRAVIARAFPEWADIPYLDKSSGPSRAVSLWEALRSIGELNLFAARRVPSLFGLVRRWGTQRVLTGAGARTAPRRVMQHFLVLEELFRR